MENLDVHRHIMMVYLPAYIYFCLPEYKSSSLKLPIAVFLKPLRLLSDSSLCVGGVGVHVMKQGDIRVHVYFQSPCPLCGEWVV